MTSFLRTLLVPLVLPFALPSGAAPFLIEDGEARATIVIADDPPRLVKLAAEELQGHLEKIGGARLPILTEAESESAEGVRIYVGRSAATDRLGIDATGLRHGAYRIVSGGDHLVLLGRDFDFDPKSPWGRKRNDLERATEEWDRLTAGKTDTAWGFPMVSIYRSFNKPTGTWAHDEGGSLQAVYGFLRKLGVRWYLPGELGEVIPKHDSIELMAIDETVRPDFPLRMFIGPAYFNAPRDAVLWGRRLGLNYGFESLGMGPKTHGLSRVHARRAMQEGHPDFYALVGGRRDTTTRGTGHACWSSPGLAREATSYARFLFDHYGEPTLQLSPQDGLRMCQCQDCSRLSPSDAVWGFLDRVARETVETHPDRLLIGAAYTSYREPPESIDRLSPNVAVRINNVGRPLFRDPAHWDWYQSLVAGWREKIASNKIVRVENNYYDTVIHPHAIARDLRTMKGLSMGEMNEVNREPVPGGQGQTWGRPGTNHLNLYVNASFLRDADQDIEILLGEYYEKFYGPAAEAMRTAFDYAEAGYSGEGRASLPLAERVRFLELLHEARKRTGDDVFGHRIQLIIDEFDSIETLRGMLDSERRRGEVPGFEYWDISKGKWQKDRDTSKLDGRLEERYWNLRGKLRSSSEKTKPPANQTRFQILHEPEALWIGIRCPDPDGTGGKDRIEFLLETDSHSFYRISIDSDGTLLDGDMAPETERGERWTANAEVAVHREDSFWAVEMRIPLVPEKEGAGDPLHHILFRRPPTKLWPWHFNLVRIRERGGDREISSFAPLEADAVLDRFSFGKLAR